MKFIKITYLNTFVIFQSSCLSWSESLCIPNQSLDNARYNLDGSMDTHIHTYSDLGQIIVSKLHKKKTNKKGQEKYTYDGNQEVLMNITA